MEKLLKVLFRPGGILGVAAVLLMIALPDVFAANYSRVNEPTTPPAFIPLPPGAVHPQGWLLDWCNQARNGITGNADSISFVEKNCSKSKGVDLGIVFRKGWTGTLYTEGNEDWCLEQSGYWLDGMVMMAYVLNDADLIKKAKARLDAVISHSTAGKSYCWYGSNWSYFWQCAVFGRGMTMYYEATHDTKILAAINTAYSTYPSTSSGTFDRNESNLENMLEAYSLGASKSIYDNAIALYQARETGDISKWAGGSFAAQHGVTWNERSKLPVIAYPWTGKKTYSDASTNAYEWLQTNHVLPFGVNSSSESLNGLGAYKSTESCDVADYMHSVTWIFRVTGDRKWADRLETACFNAGAQTHSRDFKTHVYFQAPNRIDTLNPGNASPNPNGGSQPQTYLPAHYPQCCTGNLTRFLPEYVIHMWMATYDNGLAAALYGPSVATAYVGDSVSTVFDCKTDYPFNEALTITVKPSKNVTFPMYLKIPGWCTNPSIKVNGTAVSATADTKGFAKISRAWTSGDIVSIVFPMAPRLVKTGSSGNTPAISVYLGPVLFALPIADVSANVWDKTSVWKYALNVSATDSILVTRKSISSFTWALDAPVTMTFPAVSSDWGPGSLPMGFLSGSTKTNLKLVPYGTAKFRVSVFPVTSQAFSAPNTLQVIGSSTLVNPLAQTGDLRNIGPKKIVVKGQRITFLVGDSKNMVVTINKVNGQSMYQANVQKTNGECSVDISKMKLSHGVYLISLRDGDKIVSQHRIMVF